MKKNFLILLFLSIVIGLILVNKKSDVTTYKLGNNTYRLFIAETPKDWEKGLMYYKNLDGIDGMIFVFPDKKYRTFWNKNTYLNLRVIWLDDDRKVGESYLPSIEKSKRLVFVNSYSPVNKVIELNIR